MSRTDENDTRLDELVGAMAELAELAEQGAEDSPYPDALLRKIVDLARRLGQAQYAALGVPSGGEGHLVRFVISGLNEEEVRAIGEWPRGQGLLGVLVREKRPIRLSNVTDDPRFQSFPANHPRMTAFLGVPILWEGKVLGSLYLTRKQGVAEFSADDQRIVEVLAAHAAMAIENARLVASLRGLSRVREEEIRHVSHDLRAPLTVILGQAQMLARFVNAGNRESALRALDAIIGGVRQLNVLIQDLVEAARLEAGQLELRRGPVDVAGLVAGVRSRLEPTDAPRVVVEAEPGLPTVWADLTRLDRIVTSLLTNALKCSPPESKVAVRVRSHGQGLLTEVVDEGVGIHADDLPRLFQRFYRTRQAGAAEGLGLGLYIAKRLVEAHGGRIWAESEGLGRGATFGFVLPIGRPVDPQSGSQNAVVDTRPSLMGPTEHDGRQPRGASWTLSG